MSEEKVLIVKLVNLSTLTPSVRKDQIIGRPFYNKLKDSIRKHGVKNPLLVENRPNGLFVTVGNSRLFALRELGRKRVKAVIVTYPQYFGRVKIPKGKQIKSEELSDYFPSLKKVVENPGYLIVKLDHIHLRE